MQPNDTHPHREPDALVAPDSTPELWEPGDDTPLGAPSPWPRIVVAWLGATAVGAGVGWVCALGAPENHPAPAASSEIRLEPARTPASEGPPELVSEGTTPQDPVAELRERGLLVPVRGVDPADLDDHFDDPRGNRVHGAIDIMAPRHRPVIAVEDGIIASLDEGERGGITIHQFGSRERFVYYYAHLDRYARGLEEGDAVERGQILGYVGSTGNAPDDAPHLHFTIYRLGDSLRWWEGELVNPYLVFAER